MAKQFKHALDIYGPPSLLEAMVKELKSLGYDISSGSIFEGKKVITTWKVGSVGLLLDPHKTYYDATHPPLTLPQDWDRAIALAKEGAIPEYVKVTGANGGVACHPWYEPFIGKIFKVKDSYGKSGWAIKENDFIHKENCVEATREEYEAQQKKPKFQKGDFLIHNSGNLWYVRKVNEDYYDIVSQILFDQINYTGENLGNRNKPVIETEYRKATDEEALRMLKEAYVKIGVMEGATVQYGSNHIFRVGKLGLVKYQPISLLNFSSSYSKGESQLALIGEYSSYWITPSSTDFKVVKELKIAGYEVKKEGNLLKVGCQSFTLDSLRLLKYFFNRTAVHSMGEEGEMWTTVEFSGRKFNLHLSQIEAAIQMMEV